MKKNIIGILSGCCLLFMVMVFNAHSQNPDSFTITFENDDWEKYITFDTTGDTNIWVVGKPNGNILNKAWEGENAIFTNKSKISTFPNKSTFIITVPIDTPCPHIGTLSFYFKSNSKKVNDFSLIYDEKWSDSIDLLSGISNRFLWTYTILETNNKIFNKYPPFNDTLSGWIRAELRFWALPPSIILTPNDTFNLIFSYTCDSNNNAEGLMLDFFKCDLRSTTISIIENNLNFQVFPIPASYILNLRTTKPGHKKVEFCDIFGRVVKEYTMYIPESISFNIAELLNGMYIFKIIDEEGTCLKRIIINK